MRLTICFDATKDLTYVPLRLCTGARWHVLKTNLIAGNDRMHSHGGKRMRASHGKEP